MQTRFTRGIRWLVPVLFFLVSVSFAQTADPAGSPTNIFSPVSTPAKSIFDLSLFVLAVTGCHIRSRFQLAGLLAS